MSRYLGPKHKLCRREGVKLCSSSKCPIMRRNYPPGVHGVKGRTRNTQYGTQLREKQKVKRLYGLTEKQFQNIFKNAITKKGDTGEILLKILENRFDNVIFRMGIAQSRPQARQMVNHGFFTINSKKVDIPSYQLKPKDKIGIKKSKLKSVLFKDIPKRLEKFDFPEWIHFDAKKLEGKITSQPNIETSKQFINTKYIVEFYSR